MWVPAHFCWTPLGYVFVSGHWDYPLWQRGLPFAPVRFAAVRPGFVYTPRLAVNVAYLPYSLFARPSNSWYYFGDYYAGDRLRAGYYPWFSFHNTHLGYDPLFAHTDWVYDRQHIDWEARVREVYYHRRDDPVARPARLYREFAKTGAGQDSALVRPLTEVGTSRDAPLRMERVDAARTASFGQRAKEVRQFGEQRAKLEDERLKAAVPGAPRQAVKLRLPDSPVPSPAAQTPQPKGPPPALSHPPPDVPRPAGGGKPPPGKPSDPPPRRLPTPEDVIRPDFSRRSAAPHATVTPIPPPARTPPAQPPTKPPTPPPPKAPPVVPPITGAPHPGHLLPGKGKGEKD